jgi:hypothetical protein
VIESIIVDSYFRTAIGITPSLGYLYRIHYSGNISKNKFLTIKAKYDAIDPYYMEGTTPDGPVVFSGALPHDIN